MRKCAAGLVALVVLAIPGTVAGQEAGKVAVAARALPRGAVLKEADIVYRADSTAAKSRPVVGAGVAAGWVTRRVISEGEALREPAVGPPPVIEAGDTVQAIWSDGSIELRVAGRAMNTAAAGGRVTVRVDLERRFEGVAIGAGLVRLDSPSRSR